jgi:putative transcription factor
LGTGIGVLCEICGKGTQFLKVILVEGSELNACTECAKFGVERSPRPKVSSAPVHVSEALEKREKRGQPRDVLENMTEELVPDFAHLIRKARERLGWTPEILGQKLNEKKSVVLKLESGQMQPDDALIRKLERILSIKLKDKPTMASAPKASGSRGLTLGDFIKTEKRR